MVLETTTLPIEPLPCTQAYMAKNDSVGKQENAQQRETKDKLCFLITLYFFFISIPAKAGISSQVGAVYN
jgi:hypothetical protein